MATSDSVFIDPILSSSAGYAPQRCFVCGWFGRIAARCVPLEGLPFEYPLTSLSEVNTWGVCGANKSGSAKLQRSSPVSAAVGKSPAWSGSRAFANDSIIRRFNAFAVGVLLTSLMTLAQLGVAAPVIPSSEATVVSKPHTIISQPAAFALRADLGLGQLGRYRRPTQDRALQAEALAHYATALQLEAAGKPREALTHYMDAVKADPTHPKLTAHAAELAMNYAGREKAIEILNGCLKASPKSSAAHLNLSQFYATYATEDPFEKDKAVEILSKALTLFPADAEVYRAGVLIYLTRNNRPAAEAAMAQAFKQTTESPDFWLITGRAAQEVWPLAHPEHKVIHRSKVNPFFEAAIKAANAESRPDVHLEVAQYFLLSAQIDRSGQIVQGLYEKTGDLEAAKLWVRILQAQEKDKQAVELLEKVIAQRPDDVEQRRLAVGLYDDMEAYAKAVPHMEAIVRIAGGSVEDYKALAQILLRAGLPEKALALTQRTTVLFPNQAFFSLVAAISSRGLGRPEEASTFYSKTETLAQAMSPEMLNDGFYKEWGDVLQNLKRYDDAAKKYQKSIALTPQDEPKRAAVVLNNLGYMWLELGQNLDKAGDFIRRACEFDPDSYIYKDSLGWFHFLKGNYAEALKVLLEAEQAIEKPDAGDAEILSHIGQVYEKLKDNAKAKAYFEKALKLAPKDAQIQKLLQALKSS